jgi:hypothetical protein
MLYCLKGPDNPVELLSLLGISWSDGYRIKSGMTVAENELFFNAMD